MARQKLGQHFLADPGWRQRIARAVIAPAADVEREGVWIEIGAGHGEMTELLASRARHVVAVELDRKLLPGLRELSRRLGNVTITAGDVLTVDLAALAEGHPYRVYGNIPYYITSPIIHHLFASRPMPEAAFLVMQLEVAERLVAKPGGRDYGYLSAFTQYCAESRIVFRIPPGAFRPPPKVDSALVALYTPGARVKLGVKDEPGFVEFLKACFAQKRKTLRNNLRPMVDGTGAKRLLKECGIRPDARAEQLSLPEMTRLFEQVRHG